MTIISHPFLNSLDRPLLHNSTDADQISPREVPMGMSPVKSPLQSGFLRRTFDTNPEFFEQALKFGLCFTGLQA